MTDSGGGRTLIDGPDFLIIGAMKAGTTSLFRWLQAHPGVFMSEMKEPNFFGSDRNWRRGLSWYRGLFAESAPGQIAGEASVSYSDPTLSAVASARIAAELPGVRLVFLARDPIERMRSHYRHEVLRHREDRTFVEAVADAGSSYVIRSLYFTCLQPYFMRFPRRQILVARFEDVFGPEDEAWNGLLAFLRLSERPRPSLYANRSSERAQFSGVMRMVWDAGIRRFPARVPRLVRRVAKPLLLRDRPSPLLETAAAPLPEHIVPVVKEDAERLRHWLDSPRALWASSDLVDQE